MYTQVQAYTHLPHVCTHVYRGACTHHMCVRTGVHVLTTCVHRYKCTHSPRVCTVRYRGACMHHMCTHRRTCAHHTCTHRYRCTYTHHTCTYRCVCTHHKCTQACITHHTHVCSCMHRRECILHTCAHTPHTSIQTTHVHTCPHMQFVWAAWQTNAGHL